MFKASEVPEGSGGWEPIEPGTYEVSIEEASEVYARTGSRQLRVKGRVGSKVFFDHITFEKASGEPLWKGKRLIVDLAKACGALHNDEPCPQDMEGNVVTMDLRVEKWNDSKRNRIVSIGGHPGRGTAATGDSSGPDDWESVPF